MRRYVDFKDYADRVLEKMQNGGVFLNTKCGDKVNTMVIGWGGVTYYWREPIFQAPVRHSRYTYDIIDQSNEFTVSVPLDDSMKKALAFCGTKSGRDYDKFAECGLTLADGEKVNVPIITNCALHFECKVVYKAEVDERINDEEKKSCYATSDYHTIFFGKIINCYIDE